MSSTGAKLSPSKKVNKWDASLWTGRVSAVLAQPRALNLLLVLTVLVAALLRFNGLKWDEGRHQRRLVDRVRGPRQGAAGEVGVPPGCGQEGTMSWPNTSKPISPTASSR